MILCYCFQFKNVLGAAIFIYLYVLLRLGDKEELLEFYSHNVDMTAFLQLPRNHFSTHAFLK